MGKSLNEWAKACWDNAELHGFHEEGANNNIPTQIANIHGEVSEAFEEYRKPGFNPTATYYKGCLACIAIANFQMPPDAVQDIQDMGHVNHSGLKPEGMPAELADILIRVLEMAHHYGIDIEAAVAEKHVYNTSRPFKHGKRC